MKKIRYILGIIIAVACIAGCATTPPSTTPTPTPTTTTPLPTTPPEGTVGMASNAQLGEYLVDANGMTLYYFALDVPGNGATACNTSTCLSAWTLYYAEPLSVSPPLQASDFGTITVASGEQTIYRGWPLYLYKADTTAGETGGDGFRNVWYVMKPNYSVVIMENSRVGSYLADGTGKTLYNFSIDSTDMSACTNSTNILIQEKTCIELWPAFYTESAVVPSALNPADFSMVTRSDGVMQSAYKGMPLYYFLPDTKPGKTGGQALSGFGGSWYVVSPTGEAVPTATTPSTTTVPPTTTQPSGGYGY